jgi:RNA polymerase sigma-70 factor (ECF subfamily)
LYNAEDRLRATFTSGLNGDAGAYREFLADLTRLLRGYIRARARRGSLTESIDDYIDIFAAPDDEPGEARRDIGKLLDHLPDKQKLSIMHVKLHGLSVAEAARLTGLSESAVKVSVHRGLKALAAKVRGMA